MDYSVFWSGVIAALIGAAVGAAGQYIILSKLHEKQRRAEFYQSRLEKIEPWLADLDYALMDLNIQAVCTIHVPVPSADREDNWARWYSRERYKDRLKGSLNKINEIGDRPPKVVLRSLDPDLSQSLDEIFRKLGDLRTQTVRLISDVEEATRQQQSLTKEWEERRGPPIIEGIEALRAEIARLAGLLRDLTLKTDVRKDV